MGTLAITRTTLVLVCLIAMATLAAAAMTATPAQANDFITQLFSGNFSKPQVSRRKPRSTRRSRRSYANRNYCVRLCDGYYWPIGSKAGKRQNTKVCQASCSAPARFFRIRNSGQSTEDMVDAKGKRYADLPTAFKYRKVFDQSCTCRPAPWSEASKQRHTRYAEAKKNGKGPNTKPIYARGRKVSRITTGSVSRRSRRTYKKRTVRRKPVKRDDSWMRSILGN